jgi:hypothetical protein
MDLNLKHPKVDSFLLLGGETLKWDLHFLFCFERGSIKNQTGQSEITQNSRRTLVFSILDTFSNRGKGLVGAPVFSMREDGRDLAGRD